MADEPITRDQVVAYQVRAMGSIVENMRASLASYVDAVTQSPELRARLATDPALELGGAFDLIIRRAKAIVDSAAKTGDGPSPEPPKDPPS